MRIKRSLDRISWRLSKPIAFKPNQKDVEAINEIVEYIATKEKQQLIDNQLFGKLYIFVFGEFIRHYQVAPESPIVQKELHKLLDKDLKTIVSECVDKVNNAKLAHVRDENDLKDYVPTEYNEVSANLRIMVNAALNTYT